MALVAGLEVVVVVHSSTVDDGVGDGVVVSQLGDVGEVGAAGAGIVVVTVVSVVAVVASISVVVTVVFSYSVSKTVVMAVV
jgi:hypothetical protein